MTTMTAGGRFELGRVISHTFGAIGRNLPSFLLLTIVFYTVPQFLIQWGTRTIGQANPLAMFGIGARDHGDHACEAAWMRSSCWRAAKPGRADLQF